MAGISKQTAKAKQHLEDLEKAQKDFGTAAAQTIKEAGAKIEEYGGKASKVGETLTKNVTTPLTAAAAAGVAAFSAVDEGVDTIVTATGASGEALDGLVASCETIATSIPEELGDVASAVGEVNTRSHDGRRTGRADNAFLAVCQDNRRRRKFHRLTAPTQGAEDLRQDFGRRKRPAGHGKPRRRRTQE